MNAEQFRTEVYRLTYTAEVNQRYYQIKHRRMWSADKLVKISVAVLAIVALLAAFLPHDLKWLEVVLAFAAAVAAIVLNVFPVGEWMCEYRAYFDAWNVLLDDAEQFGLRVRDYTEDVTIEPILVEMLNKLIARQCHLDDGHAPDDSLLSKCQGDVNARMYGEKIRTYEQAMQEHERINAQC